METNDRIAQWENMTQADPTNDMGWFSLGSAYKDGNREEEAATALAKAIELNPGMSRAYQLQGQVLIQLNQNDKAAEVLTEGYKVAASRGDVMPQKSHGFDARKNWTAYPGSRIIQDGTSPAGIR